MNDNIRNNYYFPSKAIKHSSMFEVHTLLQNVVDLNGDTSGSLYKKCILGIIYLCDYVTVEELSLYLGFPETSIHSLTRILHRFEEQKFIKRTDFKEKDGSSKGAYYLTKEGWQEANSYFDTIQIKEYKRKSANNVTVMHDFAVGMNVFSLLLFGVPFTFGKEISEGTSLKTGKKINKTLTYDALVIFRSKTNINRPERLYIEEDLGHETIRTLVDKLNSYENYGITKKTLTEAVVFSIKKTCTSNDDAFSAKRIGELKQSLIDSGYSRLGEYMLSFSVDNENASSFNPAADSLSRIIGFKDKNNKIHSKNDFSIEDFDEYITSLNELKNPYKAIEVNKQHDHLAKAKFRKVSAMAIADYRANTNFYKQPYVEDLMQGFCVWFVATPLLINYLPYICDSITHVMENLANNFEPRYQGFTYMNALSEPLKEDFSNRITLRNMYSYNGRYYSFDFISRDLGACLRCLRFKEGHLNYNRNITFVGIVETMDDAVVLSGDSYLGYRISDMSGFGTNKNNIVFLLKHDFEQGFLNFFVINESCERISVKNA